MELLSNVENFTVKADGTCGYCSHLKG